MCISWYFLRYQCFADRELCGKIIIPFIPEYVFLRKYYCVELFMSGKNISLGSHIHISPFSNQFLHQQLKDAHGNGKCDIFSCLFGSFQICVIRDIGVNIKRSTHTVNMKYVQIFTKIKFLKVLGPFRAIYMIWRVQPCSDPYCIHSHDYQVVRLPGRTSHKTVDIFTKSK